jgi:Zn-finger protein
MIKYDCPHYPCHDVLEDCTFCYCPFYPCHDESRGEWYEKGKTRVWDCSKCTWIHKTETVEKVKRFQELNEKIGIDSLYISTQFPI